MIYAASHNRADIGGGDGNDTITGGDQADSLSGDGDNDFIYANSTSYWLPDGNDTIDGGTGDDTVYYWGPPGTCNAVLTDAAHGNWTVTNTYTHEVDTLTNVEHVVYSQQFSF